MSYQVIARKWRPQAFDEVIGQSHVTTALRNAIRTQRVPHAILLTGPRGVGKTTLARIFARCLNCEKGPTDTPCGTCVFCEEIATGRSTDVQEIDAASRTSVDDVREVIESIRYAPSPGKHRIFVVDEVHMLSTAAFNALLKTLEEPPPSSLFIFATTNPEKIPFTVVSRCQRYDLRRIQTADVAEQLGQIAAAEGIEISKTSLLAIAREGDGSMRDAQTLLDQLIAYGGETIADETVAEVLDLIDRRVLLAIVGACIDGDAAAALDACGRAVANGSEPKRLAGALVELLRDLVVVAVAPGAEGLVEGSDAELEELRELSARCEPARLRRMFRALVKEHEDLAWAPQPYSVLEMAIVRLATLPAGDDVVRLLARLDALERKLGGGGGGGTGSSGGAAGGGGTRGGSRTSGGGGPARPSRPGRRSAEAAPNEAAQNEAAPNEATQNGATQNGATQNEATRNEATRNEATRNEASDAASGPRSEPAADTSPGSPPGPSRVPGLEPVGTSEAVGSPPDPGAIPPPDDAHAPHPPPAAPPPVPASEGAAGSQDEAPLPVVFDRLRLFALDHDRGGFASLEGGRLLERRPGSLRIEARNGFHLKRLRDRQAELDALCSRFFDRPTRVELVEPDGSAAPSRDAASRPAASDPGDRALRREEERRLRQAALQHPAVNVALEVLEASIVDIQPHGGPR